MIDVIIPTYNAHKYLDRCLLSLNMQTIKDLIKIYIINDGSDFNYDSIVNKFNKKLDIKEIDLKDNKGPGNARNMGLDVSSSEYVFFMDSDDELVNSISLELLLNNIKDNDLCIGGVVVEDENNNQIYTDNYKNTLHGKLFKRKFLMDNKLQFNDSYRSEDNSFYNLVMLLEPTICYINKPIYYYKYNDSSLTDVDKDVFIDSYNYNVSWVIESSIKRNISDSKIAKYLYKSFIYNYFLYNNYDRDFKELINSFKKYNLKYFTKYFDMISEDEKLEIINEYKIDSTSYISIDDFYNLLVK